MSSEETRLVVSGDQTKSELERAQEYRVWLLRLEFFGSLVLAVLELVIASFSRSLSLVADGLIMLIDNFVYAANLFAISGPTDTAAEALWRQNIRRFAPLFGAVTLISVAVLLAAISIVKIVNKEDDDLDQGLGIFLFGVSTLIWDAYIIGNFFYEDWRRRAANKAAKQQQQETNALASTSTANVDAPQADKNSEGAAPYESMKPTASGGQPVVIGNDDVRDPLLDQPNMFSAFSHVFADFLRGFGLLLVGVATYVEGVNETLADSVVSIIVCAMTIFLGGRVLYLAHVKPSILKQAEA